MRQGLQQVVAQSYPLLPAAAVTDQASLQAWMEQVQRTQPDWMPGGPVSATLANASYFMATYGDGRFLFSTANNGGFNA
jgi:hypothetical protein